MYRKAFFRLIAVIPVMLILIACSRQASQVQPIKGLPEGTDGYAWWNDTVFYELFVRSFYDSDGDGVGDFNGIIEKLDYLNDGDPIKHDDLGITGIWLMPINPSPTYHGYDVTDYYSVNPDYGSMEDFKRLLSECHKRGIRVVMDLVLNHTSSQNPWFIEARDKPESERNDWYIWSETNPGYLGPAGQKVWYPSAAGFYYAIFWVGMPDLNYRDEDVTNEMHNVTRFWLQEVGVDGFRLDAARHLIEEGEKQADTISTHEWWSEYRTFYKQINPEAVAVGEIWTTNYAVVDYVEGDELDMAFNFDLASQVMRNVFNRDATNLGAAIQSSSKLFKSGTYATFLTNHDQERVMSSLMGDEDKAKLAAAVMLTSPGTPFIYYGEEIGMTGKKPDEYIRTPMLWSAERSAGFSSAFPWESVNRNYKESNVEIESTEPSSLLNLYRTLIRLRNEHAALRVGDFYLVRSDESSILSFLRVSEKERVLVLINLSEENVSEYKLTLTQGPLAGSYHLIPIFGAGEIGDLEVNPQGGFTEFQPGIELPANGVIILQMR